MMNLCKKIILLGMLSGILWAETLILSGDEWCPYNCSSVPGHEGYTVEIVQKVFAAHKIDVEYRVTPWARAIRELEHGVSHAIIGASKTKERLEKGYIYPEKTIGIAQNIFFVLSGEPWKYRNIASLEGIILGVQRDYQYGVAIDAYIQSHSLDPNRIQIVAGSHALSQNLSKLKLGRVDTVLEDRSVGFYAIKKQRMVGLFEEAGKLEADPLYIAFSPKFEQSERYAKILDKGLKKLRKNGVLKQILQKYGLKDWE